MDNFITHFVRHDLGRWTCIAAAQIELVTGRIEVTPGTRLSRGTAFMGVDVAELLDRHYEAFGLCSA